MTIQEVYNKVMASDELKQSFAAAAQDKDALTAWLKEQNCDATVEEVAEFLKGQNGELSDADLENVAGGGSKLFDSIISIGIACFVSATYEQADRECNY